MDAQLYSYEQIRDIYGERSYNFDFDSAICLCTVVQGVRDFMAIKSYAGSNSVSEAIYFL